MCPMIASHLCPSYLVNKETTVTLCRIDTDLSLAKYLRRWFKDGYGPAHAVECAVVACRERGNEATQARVAELNNSLHAPGLTLRIGERIVWDFIHAAETAASNKEA